MCIRFFYRMHCFANPFIRPDFLRIVGWGIGFLDVETSGGLGTLSQSISLWIAMDARQQSESEVP